jgi:hypothetical protein
MRRFYDFATPNDYTEFFLRDYEIISSSGPGHSSDINYQSFVQTDWSVGYTGVQGDVSFGSPDDDGPATSFAAHDLHVVAWPDQVVGFPGPVDGVYAIGSPADKFRIGFSEVGTEWEGWIAWSSGEIGVR